MAMSQHATHWSHF